jgi:hypothetical protein
VLVFHAYPVGPSPHDNAMPGGVIKVQVEFHRQIEGILQPERGSGRREVSNRAIERGSIAQDDPADHQNVVPRDDSAFASLIWANGRQRLPRGRPISNGGKRRQLGSLGLGVLEQGASLIEPLILDTSIRSHRANNPAVDGHPSKPINCLMPLLAR